MSFRNKKNYLEYCEATQGDHHQRCADNVKKPNANKTSSRKLQTEKAGRAALPASVIGMLRQIEPARKIESEAARRRKLSDDGRAPVEVWVKRLDESAARWL